MFSSNSGRFDTLLGFLGGTGRAPPEKNRKLRSSKLLEKALPIYFCYLCSFKSFTVPLGGPFFLFFLGGGGGRACVPGST